MAGKIVFGSALMVCRHSTRTCPRVQLDGHWLRSSGWYMRRNAETPCLLTHFQCSFITFVIFYLADSVRSNSFDRSRIELSVDLPVQLFSITDSRCIVCVWSVVLRLKFRLFVSFEVLFELQTHLLKHRCETLETFPSALHLALLFPVKSLRINHLW